jgi:hypothetical protein
MGEMMTLEEYNRALLVVSRARGHCWCYVPIRQLVDVTGMTHAPCGQQITGASGALTVEQRDQAVRTFYAIPGKEQQS